MFSSISSRRLIERGAPLDQRGEADRREVVALGRLDGPVGPLDRLVDAAVEHRLLREQRRAPGPWAGRVAEQLEVGLEPRSRTWPARRRGRAPSRGGRAGGGPRPGARRRRPARRRPRAGGRGRWRRRAARPARRPGPRPSAAPCRRRPRTARARPARAPGRSSRWPGSGGCPRGPARAARRAARRRGRGGPWRRGRCCRCGAAASSAASWMRRCSRPSSRPSIASRVRSWRNPNTSGSVSTSRPLPTSPRSTGDELVLADGR